MGLQLNKLSNSEIHILNIDGVKGEKVAITMDKTECHKCSSDVQFLNTRLNLQNKTAKVDEYHVSEIIVLMIAIKPKEISKLVQDKR